MALLLTFVLVCISTLEVGVRARVFLRACAPSAVDVSHSCLFGLCMVIGLISPSLWEGVGDGVSAQWLY